jgi:UDP-glucuronate decarboxylase
MLFAAAIFALSSPSSPVGYTSPSGTVAASFNHLANGARPSLHESVGGKVPLGLRRRVQRVLVTGGAGFVGSHLVDRLMERGDSVIVVDNFFTGRKGNVAHHLANPRFEVIRHDVVEPILLEVDQIYHLACPASPVHYKYNPIKTIISLLNYLV